MRPPECAICDKDVDLDKGGLVYFKKRDSDIAWQKRMDEIDGVGHPPWCDWFCKKHIKKAEELKHLPIDEAFKLMKSK